MKRLAWLVYAAVAATSALGDPAANTLTDEETKEGWLLLWDGQTTKGWQSVNGAGFPKSGWEIKDGMLTVLGSKGGDIITEKKYANFDLRADFKLTPGANSGIKYFIDPAVSKSVGFEFQVLDDAKHPDAKLGHVLGCRSVGALYDLFAPASNKPVKPIGEWNTARILVQGMHGEHWLNGEKVVAYDRGSEEFKAEVAKSKFKDAKNFGMLKEGHILLQDHGNVVSFRNIKLKVLPN